MLWNTASNIYRLHDVFVTKWTCSPLSMSKRLIRKNQLVLITPVIFLNRSKQLMRKQSANGLVARVNCMAYIVRTNVFCVRLDKLRSSKLHRIFDVGLLTFTKQELHTGQRSKLFASRTARSTTLETYFPAREKPCSRTCLDKAECRTKGRS